MCGISGIYNFSGGEVREKDLTAMRETLVHRGPDGGHNYLSLDRRVGLSQRRLAIIDLHETAACPMANEDGTVWITFNGEIYNFKPLREELRKKGHTFKTEGDTETILHGYEEYGEDIAGRLNGMFAFVIWDERGRKLFAARDHAGVKPFYYAVQNGVFYFGSEIKAILAHPDFKKEFEEEHADYYLTFACLPAPYTLFRDVKKLPAAHSLTIDPSGAVAIREYWDPYSTSSEKRAASSEQDYVDEIRSILKDSIEMQMVSDVPFGCFLSGGIDSSTNAALMSQALGKPVETFSIGSEEHVGYNEFEYSRMIAKRLGARTHEMVVTREDLLRFLPKYAWHADDPNGDQICFLVYCLSELIRKSGVIVAQVGEGADELFAGYPAYLRAVTLYERFWKHLARLPRGVRALPHALGRPFFSPAREFEEEYLRRFRDGEEPFWGNAIAFTPSQKEKLLSERFKQQIAKGAAYSEIKRMYTDADARDPRADFLKRMTYLELKIRLPELLLARVDRMGMAHSIEARVPFLDPRLIELALQIPQDMKLKQGQTKYILKKAVEGIIPDEIIWRKKQGFGAPMTEWLRNPETAKPLLEPIFTSRLRERGLFKEDYIRTLIAAHQNGSVNNNFRIWNLVTLSLWYDRWF